MKKNKIKTHKSSAKKFKKTNSGLVKFKRQGANHNTVSYPAKRMRKLRKSASLSSSDAKRLKSIIERLK